MEKKQEKQMQIQFKLMDVEEIQFQNLTNGWPEGELQVSNQMQFQAETDKRILRCKANFEYKKNDITQLLLTVQTTFDFAPESWSQMYNLDDDAWILPAGLMQHIADITIGASRGILAVRTADQGLPHVIIPLVNPAQIVRANFKFPRTPQQA